VEERAFSRSYQSEQSPPVRTGGQQKADGNLRGSAQSGALFQAQTPTADPAADLEISAEKARIDG
jgi:hypothetical protein